MPILLLDLEPTRLPPVCEGADALIGALVVRLLPERARDHEAMLDDLGIAGLGERLGDAKHAVERGFLSRAEEGRE